MSVDPSSRNQLDSRTSRKSPTKINKKNTKVFQENEKKNSFLFVCCWLASFFPLCQKTKEKLLAP